MSDLVENPNCWFSHAQAQLISRKQWLCPYMTDRLFTGMLYENRNKEEAAWCELYEPCHEKTNNVVFEQVRHKPICRSTEDG